jgi:lysophospholipase L1-like esterase
MLLRNIRAALACAVGAMALLSGAAPATADKSAAPPPPAASKRTYVVAAMGDSLTDPKSHGGKYLDRLKEHCPKSRFDSYGKGGQMVNQMRKRFARDVLGEGGDGSKPKYTHVLVLGGIGDILSNETAGRTAEKIETDLAKMYSLAKEQGVEVIALTLPPWGSFQAYDPARHRMTLDVNDWIRKQPKAGTVTSVIDIYPLLSCGKQADLCEKYGWKDRLHWSDAGHAVVGEALRKAIFSDCG